MNIYYALFLTDNFNYEKTQLPGGFISIQLAADYLDRLINELNSEGYDFRRSNRFVSYANLAEIEIKQTDQCHWERGNLPEEFASNFQNDLQLIRKFIQESDERNDQYLQELEDMAIQNVITV
ncbi:hypothetical protein [Algoriphagus]|uniref:Uncharacterized protein n=1 Tax=Algoriphagus formosus TaxID=2007308 RepID=A0A4R5UW52_9BACT|nr:hypothetical protein [Algoriphagus]TDK43472.1 hypothetical protein E1898_12760 [Algoriphagus aquimaris]